MPITLPSYVATNELIESAWGNAVVDALDELDDEKLDLAGGTMTGQLVVGTTGTYHIVVDDLDNSNTCAIRFDANAAGTEGRIGFLATDRFHIENLIAAAEMRLTTPGDLEFYTGGTQSALINSSGVFRVGGDPASTAGIDLQPDGAIQSGMGTDGVNVQMFRYGPDALDDGDRFLSFFRAGSQIGTVTIASTSTVAYNTSSDPRAKQVDGPVDDAAGIVARLGGKAFVGRWIGDDGEPGGDPWVLLSSHDVEDEAPWLVTGERDAVDADGNPSYQMVNFPAAVPLLCAAISELVARIEALEAAA